MRRFFLSFSVALCSFFCIEAQTTKVLSHVKAEDCPNGVVYLPAPPTLDDPRFIYDWTQYRWGIAQRETDRCELALIDGSRDCAQVLKRFAPAIGFTITQENAPKTFELMERLRMDATVCTSVPKMHYERRRPFQQFQEPTPCPQYEDSIPRSYPSAHTAQGWLYAMVLSFFDPQCQDEIYRIGYDYGQSRVILGFHYQSDVDAGRLSGAAVFSRLLAEPGFLDELLAAKAEYLALKEQLMNRPIVILYDNDVHCGIDGYVQMAGLRDAIAASDTAYVAVVSSGDFVQGGTAGTLSKGQYIIDIVNSVGYDAMTIGNHEFDYGTPRLLELTSQLNAPVTCVNFSDITNGEQFYAPYVMKQFGARRVAFVGALTPSTLSSEASAFYDENGHQLYGLHHDDVYELVQNSVNNAREAGADYVVVLSHLGEANSDVVSGDLIAHTTGIDAVLDGHSHAVIPCNYINNKDGHEVISTQTGTKFVNVGKLLIQSNGQISTELLPVKEIQKRSEFVAAVVDSIKQINAALTNKVCGINEQLLTINGPDGKRLVRRGETNLANFVADAFRWFGDSDLALVNGGGVRTDLPQGDISYGRIMDVQPFDNQLCVAKVSGALLCSVLDIACADLPAESGMLVHSSGFRYTVNLSDEVRVSNVEVLNASGEYEPIDADKEYSLTAYAYLFTQFNGLLQNVEFTKINIGADAEAIYQYVVNPLGGRIGATYAQPQGRLVIH